MTTLTEAMLELARTVGWVREGTATGGSTTTMVDTAMDEPPELFKDGALFMTSGSSSGQCREVKTHALNTLTADAAFTSAVVAGNTYAVTTSEASKSILKQAIRYVLKTCEITKMDDTGTLAQVMTLPTGVSNVKRVKIDGDVNYKWHENGGLLYFDDDPGTGTVELWYMGYCTEPAETGTTATLDEAVPLRWLVWSAAEYYWRQYIQKQHKDNNISPDMLNEAKQNAEMARVQSKRYDMRVMNRDPHHANW